MTCCEVSLNVCHFPLGRYTKPQFLFQDVASIGAGMAKDVLSGEPQPIPKVDVLTFGWMCSDNSFLNNNRKKFKGDFAKGEQSTGRSGRTLFWCLEHTRVYKPRLVIAENVPSIASTDTASSLHGDQPDCPNDISNLQHVLDTLATYGYMATSVVLDAADMGAAAKRKIIYIVAVLSHSASKDDGTMAERESQHLVRSLAAVAPKCDIRQLFMPSDNADLVRDLKAREHDLTHARVSKVDWDDHDAVFAQVGFHGERNKDMLTQVTSLVDSSLLGLSARQIDILF